MSQTTVEKIYILAPTPSRGRWFVDWMDLNRENVVLINDIYQLYGRRGLRIHVLDIDDIVGASIYLREAKLRDFEVIFYNSFELAHG